MAVAETARLVLYFFEWIWTVVVLGIIPSQLIQKGQPLSRVEGGRGDVCSLTQTLGTSKCQFGIAWAAIAFAILTIAIVWHCMDYCTGTVLPDNVETVIFGWLALWWLVAGIVFPIVKSKKAPQAANVLIVFSWMLAVMSAISSVLATRSGTKSRRASPSLSSDGDSMIDDEESHY